MDGGIRERASAEDDFRRRGRIQKLRWLGLDQEADRLAAEAPAEPRMLRTPLPVDYPETD
ncbi:MAG TPA: hypothetical protein VKU84_00665 [Stellaceae bacterium]|nr:hypothetical protein [Stellaceae bacterium]